MSAGNSSSRKPGGAWTAASTMFKSKSTRWLESVPDDPVYHGTHDVKGGMNLTGQVVDGGYVFVEDSSTITKKSREQASRALNQCGHVFRSVEAWRKFRDPSNPSAGVLPSDLLRTMGPEKPTKPHNEDEDSVD